MKLCLKLHGLGVPPDGGLVGSALADGVSPGGVRLDRTLWVDTDRFARIVDWAARNRDQVHLTFDDGNDSDVAVALPALRDAGLGGSFFFSTDFLGRPGYASEDDIRALAAAGMEIGSHGATHTSWLGMSGDAIVEDVICSFARLESILGKRIAAVAPPFDACDARVLRILHRTGIGRVYGGFSGPASDRDWLVRRIAVTSATSIDALDTYLRYHMGRMDWFRGALGAALQVGEAAFWRRRHLSGATASL